MTARRIIKRISWSAWTLLLVLASSSLRGEDWSSDNSSTSSKVSTPEVRRSAGWHPNRSALAPKTSSTSRSVPEVASRPLSDIRRETESARSAASTSVPWATEDRIQPAGESLRGMRVGGNYEPDWQRESTTLKTSREAAPRTAMRIDRSSSYMSPVSGRMIPAPRPSNATFRSTKMTQPARPASSSPFVEDEVIRAPQPAQLPEPNGDGTIEYENAPSFDGLDSCGECGAIGPCDADGLCSGCATWDPMACERFHVCSLLSPLNEFGAFGGVQAFKGPVDGGLNGNFGFHTGLNLGDAIWHEHGIGYQVGAQYVVSDFYGTVAPVAQSESRRQIFITAGLFHRAYYNCGLQYGVVFDYLNDRYYYNATVNQLRTEISYVCSAGHELGCLASLRGRSQTLNFFGTDVSFQPINMVAGFYRYNTCNGGFGRLWVGGTGPIPATVQTRELATGTNAVVLGGDYRMSLTNCVDFMGNFNALLPTQSGTAGRITEAWGLNMNLVFYPFRCRHGTHNGPYRPLFNVADNSNFILSPRVN